MSDKRDLAVLVAERAAPQLVPRIRGETGLDLTREQVQAVIDMAGRMDADDIDELRHAVRDPEAREQTLRTVGASAAAAAAGATGLDDVVTPGEHDRATEPDEHEPTTEPAERPATSEPEPAEGDTMTPDGIGVTPADLDLPPVRETADLTTRVRATQHPLVELLRRQTTGAGCVRAVRAHVEDIAEMDSVGLTAVVDAVPDGWARRRALEAMLDARAVPSTDVGELVQRLGSPVARAWVCATAIEAGLLDADRLDDLIDQRAATRLRGRYR